jgi:hypothetical protein
VATGVAGLVAAVSCIPDLPPAATAGDASGTGEVGDAAAAFCGDGIIHLDGGEQCDPGHFGDAAVVQGCTRDCKMDCDGGVVWAGNNHCYVDLGTSDNPQPADKCVLSGQHVVTFASDEELRAASSVIEAGVFWVGLTSASAGVPGYISVWPLEPGWESSCPGCYAHVDAAHPLDLDAGDCVRGFVDLSRPWESVACQAGSPHHLICEREPVGRLSVPCDAGSCFELVRTKGIKRYVFVRPPAHADEAERNCIALGGSLVVLQSRDEREQLWRELSPSGNAPDGIWIGLSAAAGGTLDAALWSWDDDAAQGTYSPEWAVGQPGGTSTRAFLFQPGQATVDETLARNDPTPPGKGYPYVCQLPPQ